MVDAASNYFPVQTCGAFRTLVVADKVTFKGGWSLLIGPLLVSMWLICEMGVAEVSETESETRQAFRDLIPALTYCGWWSRIASGN